MEIGDAQGVYLYPMRFECRLIQPKWSSLAGSGALESGSGPGSYDIRQSVWHVDVSQILLSLVSSCLFISNLSSQCCSPTINGGGGWGIFNAIFGWQNSATYGSVISYNLYWVCVIAAFLAMRYNEQRGHWPFLKRKPEKASDAASTRSEDCTQGRVTSTPNKTKSEEGVKTTTKSIDI